MATSNVSLPTDPFELLQFNMSRVHEAFKRGFERIHDNLVDPPTDDLKNFLGYCGLWAACLLEHHHTEELLMFPLLTQKMDFSGELESHNTIHDMLDKIIAFIDAAQKDHSNFRQDEMRVLVEQLREPLFHHLDEEVNDLEPDKLRTAGVEEKDLVAMLKEIDRHAVEDADPFVMLPFIRSHTSAEYRNIFPPLPWLMRNILVPYFFARRYSGYWKYAPFSVS